MTKQELLDILEAGSAATIIVRVYATKMAYSKDVDHTELLRIMNVASVVLQNSLKKDIWKDHLSQYKAPIYDEMLPPPIVLGILGASTDLLKDENILKLGENLSKELVELYKNLDEIMIFDCKFPINKLNPDFDNEKRYLMLLQKYWAEYLKIIQSIGDAPIFYRPNPLSRFILNLQYRIEHCVNQLGDEHLLETYRKMSFDPIASQDFDIEWECGGQEMAMEFDKVLNELVMKTGIRRFDLTMQEEMFLETCGDALESVNKRVKDDWNKMLIRADKQAEKNKNLSQQEIEPITCSAYIKKVENNLRNLVKTTYKNSFLDEWLNKIRSVLGETAYLKAIDTMKSRKVNELEEILYFTNLTDIHMLISKEWGLFKDCFSIRRNIFNATMSVIIKGRTEEAHSRPEHLWPKIEQERTKVACHDLLNTIKVK